MLQYLLEVTLCWAVFYAIFFAFLRQVTFFSVNRWYLLSTLMLGIFIPLLRHVEIDLHQEEISQALPLVMMVGEMPAQMAISVEEATIDWQLYIYWTLGGVYFIGFSFFAYRLLRSLYKIYQLKSMARVEVADQATLLHTDQPHLPFSFLHYIFISDQVALSEEYDDILRHEIEHVRSHHTIDVLLIELIQILFWFNPFIYLYKTAIRQTHEYLADAAVLQSTNRKTYGTMLLKQSLSGLEIALTHRFFHSHIKKRINMIYQKQSGRSAWLKYALALPVLFFLTVVFARHNGQDLNFKMYSSTSLKEEINFFCDSDKGSVFPVIFLDNTIESQYKSGLKNTHFILPSFFKQLNYIYDPNKHLTIYIDDQRITSKEKLPIDFSQPWIAEYLEIISPKVAEIEYGAPLGVMKIKRPSNDISLYENYVNQIDGENLGTKYMYNRNSSHNTDGQNKESSSISFDVEKWKAAINAVLNNNEKKKDVEVELTNLVKKWLKQYPRDHDQILDHILMTPLNHGLLVRYETDLVERSKLSMVKDIDRFEVYTQKINRNNLTNSITEAESVLPSYENLAQIMSARYKVGEKPSFESYLEDYIKLSYPIRHREDMVNILSQHFERYFNEHDIAMPIQMSELQIKSGTKLPSSLMSQLDKELESPDMPIIWSQEWIVSLSISDFINTDQPIGAVYSLPSDKAQKIFGDRGQRGFYALMGYDRPRSHPMKQKEMMNFELENFFQTISQTDESSWVTKLKEVHHQLREKYPLVTDWTTPFTTRAHAHDINLVIIDNEIIKAYKASGADYERLDKEVRLDKDMQEKPSQIFSRRMLDSSFPISQFDNQISFGSYLDEKLIEVSVEGEILKLNKDYSIDKAKGIITVINKNYINQAKPVRVRFIDGDGAAQNDKIKELLHTSNTIHDKPLIDIIIDFYREEQIERPLYLINGQVVNFSLIENLKHEEIQSIGIIADPDELNKYDATAKYGIIKFNLFEQQNDKIYKVVDEMPRFPGCEEIEANTHVRKTCADEKLLQYLYENLKYPKIAMDNGVEGRVYIQFVVDKDGSIENAKIVRDIGAGCGQAALEVVNRMNDMPDRWTPGKEDGQVVKVLYTLPVTFKIAKDVPQDTVVIFDPENFSEMMLIHPSDESAPEMRNEQSREYLVELIQSSFGSIISGSVSLYGTINPEGSIMWSLGSDSVGDSNRADFDKKSKEVIEKIVKRNISMASHSGSTSFPDYHKLILTVPIK